MESAAEQESAKAAAAERAAECERVAARLRAFVELSELQRVALQKVALQLAGDGDEPCGGAGAGGGGGGGGRGGGPARRAGRGGPPLRARREADLVPGRAAGDGKDVLQFSVPSFILSADVFAAS